MRRRSIFSELKHGSFVSRRRLIVTASGALAVFAAHGRSRAAAAGAAPPDGFFGRVDDIVGGIKAPKIPGTRFPIAGNAAGGDIRIEISEALRTASEAGGGRVVIPAGRYVSNGPIHLRSRCALHLEDGAHIVFSGDPQHYLPAVFTRWEGTEAYNYSPFIYGRDLEDVAITGAGTFDGRGAENWLPWRAEQKDDQALLRDMGRRGVPINERRFGEGRFLRPQFLQFIGCERVLIEGVTFLDSPFWVVHPVYCRHVTVRGVTVVSEHVNSDGVDPDSCEDVLIEDCAFNTGDDGVAVKAGRDQDGWRVGRPCRRVVVRNCRYTGTAGGGVAIGSEMSGGVEEVFVHDYDMRAVKHAIYLKSNSDRGGYVRDCHFRNIAVGEAKDLLVITNNYKEQGSGLYPAAFEDISFADIRCADAEAAISILGAEKAAVRRLQIENLRVGRADLPLRARNVRSMTFSNVMINREIVEAVEETPPETFDKARHY